MFLRAERFLVFLCWVLWGFLCLFFATVSGCASNNPRASALWLHVLFIYWSVNGLLAAPVLSYFQ